MNKNIISIKNNKKKFIDNLFIVVIMWGWLILSNCLELFGININLYSYLLIVSPIYAYMIITGNYYRISIKGLFFSLIPIVTLIYFLLLGSINNNLNVHTKYYANMMHISFIVLPTILLNINKLNLYFYQIILYNISKVFIILAFFNIASKSFIIDSRFLEANITAFLVAQFIIIYYFKKHQGALEKFIMIVAIVVLLACGTRSGLMALVFTLVVLLFKQQSNIKKLYNILIITLTYIISYNLYYKLINIYELRIYLRPLGVLFLDQSNILNKASMGRIDYLQEYIEKIASNDWNLLFGLGPNSFTNYSHNLIVDLIGFGGIFVFLVYIILFIYILYKSNKNLIYYQFIFFSIAFCFTSSFFLNSIYFAIMLLMFCLPKTDCNIKCDT